jgi:hypothetical protein
MSGVKTVAAQSEVVIKVGALPIRFWVEDPAFVAVLKRRYAGFVSSAGKVQFDFDVELVAPTTSRGNDDVRVEYQSGLWCFQRGDFQAIWNPDTGRGLVRQTMNPYSLDCVLRIVHTLLLAKKGGFLLHSASAIRNGRAFLFAGDSGAGKTTISRLAPHDTTLLTDEVSYVYQEGGGYFAFGTPFTGELGCSGENVRAHIAGLYFLEKGPANKTEALEPAAACVALLKNILCFTHDHATVDTVFQSACKFVREVPAHKLTFTPDSRVWELIG